MKIFFAILFTAAISVAHAQTPPGAQVLGPAWQGQTIRASGTVIAKNDHCRQIAVDRDGLPGVGGRLWGCWKNVRHAPDMGEVAHIHGKVTTTRMTRMGPFWRVVPQINGL